MTLMKKYPTIAYFLKPEQDYRKKLFLDIFEQILIKCIELGLVSREGMLIDSTIVKADASYNSMVEINLSPEEYWKRLDQSERPKKKLVGERFIGKVDKNKMGKRRRDINSINLRKKSTTDPDATLFYRPSMGSHLSYKAHIATDTNGLITAVS